MWGWQIAKEQKYDMVPPTKAHCLHHEQKKLQISTTTTNHKSNHQMQETKSHQQKHAKHGKTTSKLSIQVALPPAPARWPGNIPPLVGATTTPLPFGTPTQDVKPWPSGSQRPPAIEVLEAKEDIPHRYTMKGQLGVPMLFIVTVFSRDSWGLKPNIYPLYRA